MGVFTLIFGKVIGEDQNSEASDTEAEKKSDDC